MTTAVGLQRAGSAVSPVGAAGKLPNLPVIEHPMSRLGDRNDLAVRGSSTYGSRGKNGLQRSHTDVGFRGPHGADGANLRKSTPERILNWPPEFLKGPGKPHVKSKEYNYQPRTTQELIELIREKFGTGFFGIRHLFKANDPTGKGAVSKEALQRILYTLCGYITPDQYTKLLRAMHLEGKSPIHFEIFVQYFKETDDKKNWVSALQTSSMQQGDVAYPETYLRRHDMQVHDPYTSMPFSDAIFKEKCKSKNFDARKVFPASVFESNGLILPPQLREAYATLGIYMTDEDFNKLWQRYDKEGTGAIHREDFFRVCGLDAQGRPRQAAPYTPRGAAYPKSRQRPHSEIGHTNGMDTDTELKKILKKEGVEPTTAREEKEEIIEGANMPEANKGAANENKDEAEAQRKVDFKRQHKPAPKLENIIDCLHYKFEEAYQAMLTAFQLFDFLNDGYVSKVDFRRVLGEFGFTISPTELDYFLKKNGMRAIKGQISYREFLNRFQSKSLSSITARTATDASHAFHTDGAGSTGEAMTADTLEARLIDHFHGDFIKLLSHFRQCDKYNLHVITAHEFRSGIERRLGYQMTETQWEQLKADVGEDRDGLIPYARFLEFFDISPGSWNVRQEGGISVAQVCQADMPSPPQIDRLMERSKTEMAPPAPSPAPDKTGAFRSLEEIKRQLDELFKIKFHTFDKNFKAMDRKMTGRMSKWQFGALLKMCGLSLQPGELDRIWATLNVSTDGMYSYSTLIQHFINYKIPHEEKENLIYEDTTELVETARRIQRERREEQMKRDHIARMKARESNEDWQPEGIPTVQPSTTPRAGTASTTISRVSVPSVPASRASFSSVQSIRTKTLLVKIRSDVINNWEGLKSVFKYLDRNGTSFVSNSEIKEVMTSMQFSMTEEEKTELCRRFDTQKNGRFNYMQFMKCYAQRSNKQKSQNGGAYSKFTHQLQTQLLKEHRTLRRAFKKLDHGFKGYLSVQDFRRALLECRICFSNEDFYHIMTEFDRNMDGRISYDLFLKTILNL